MLSFLKSVYRSARRKLAPTFPTPFPIKYNAQHHEIDTIGYFSQPQRQLLREINNKFTYKKQVVICFTNRCGSNWLAELLHSTGKMGLADELFNIDRIQASCDEFNIRSLDDYIRQFSTSHSTANGVFATKLSWDQLYFLSRIEVIPRLIPKPYFIYLMRKDIAAQALSLAIAQKTGQWKSNWNDGTDKQISLDAISDTEISEKIAEIKFSQSQFELYFSTFHLKPYRIYYEDLQENPEGKVAEILRYLRLFSFNRKPLDASKITLERQRNEQSEKRLAQFHANTEYHHDHFPQHFAA